MVAKIFKNTYIFSCLRIGTQKIHTKNLTNLKEDTQHFDKTGGF